MGALDGEIEYFRKQLNHTKVISFHNNNFHKGSLKNHDVIIVRSGVGKVLSAMVTQFLIDNFKPDGLIFTGVAGAINDRINLGDIIVGKDTVQHDLDVTHFKFPRGQIPETPYRFIEADSKLYSAALEGKIENHSVLSGRILTGDQFISGKEIVKMRYLTEELNGDCVDMEGASVSLVCKVNGISHLVLRTISDRPGQEEKINIRTLLKESSRNSLSLVLQILDKIDK